MNVNDRIRSVLLTAAAIAAAATISACGGDDEVGGGSDRDVQTAQGGVPEGKVTISNWPSYIDKGSITEFEQKTGVEVDWIEDINDNVEFFGKLQPLLDQGKSGDRSLFVVTDWMAKQMYDLGYLQELNHDDLATVFENLAPQFESEGVLDPEHKFSIPWQGGMTGIWVNTTAAPEIESVNDLFDPKYKGRVTMLSELRDTVPLVMRGEGIETEDATKEDWLAAIDKLQEAADSGQIRHFTGNDYTQDLNSGNVIAAIGWSGDSTLITREDAEWRRPLEGCNLWFDTMVIPAGAPNTAAALEFMNFAYTPEVQADIAEYVNYVTPVNGVQEILTARDPAVGESQLIFPDDEFVKDCVAFTEPPGSAADQQEITEAFQAVVTG